MKREFGKLTLSCIEIVKAENNLVKLLIKDLNLGLGEAEVISLAKEWKLKALIDEKQARKIAKNLDLQISGTIGFLIKAEKLGLINSAYNMVQKLNDAGFFVSERLVEQIKDMYKKDEG